MEPVSPTSASLLRLESPGAQLHAGWLARLEAHGRRELDVEALQARIAQRLESAPRLRATLAPRAAGSGELVWREDPGFDVARHVVAWGSEAGEEEVRVIVERFLEQPLTRERPLWRMLVVPRTRAGGPVVAAKLHRALADGHDAGLLRELVFDAPSGPDAGTPTASASTAQDDALAEYRSARALREQAAGGSGAGRIGTTLRRAAFARSEGALVAAPPSFLDGPAGGRRTLVTARAELGRLARIAARTGTTLHAVVLAVLAGTLRRLALARGEPPADLRALVPLRIDGEELLGEAPCAVVELPVGERSPASRLAAIHAAVDAATRIGADTPAGGPAPTLIAGPPEESRRASRSGRASATSRSPARPDRRGGCASTACACARCSRSRRCRRTTRSRSARSATTATCTSQPPPTRPCWGRSGGCRSCSPTRSRSWPSRPVREDRRSTAPVGSPLLNHRGAFILGDDEDRRARLREHGRARSTARSCRCRRWRSAATSCTSRSATRYATRRRCSTSTRSTSCAMPSRDGAARADGCDGRGVATVWDNDDDIATRRQGRGHAHPDRTAWRRSASSPRCAR